MSEAQQRDIVQIVHDAPRDKLSNLIRNASPEQLRVMVAWLWGGLQHVRPTNQSEREWYEALCKTVGMKP